MARYPRVFQRGLLSSALAGVLVLQGCGSRASDTAATAGSTNAAGSPGSSGSPGTAGAAAGGSANGGGAPSYGGTSAGASGSDASTSGADNGGVPGNGLVGSNSAGAANGGSAGGGSAGMGSGGASSAGSGSGGMGSGGSATGALHVEGRFLVDGDGKQVLMRGPELVYRWGVYSGITSLGVDVPWEGGRNNNVGSDTIGEIAKTKGSAMRLLGGIGAELDDVPRAAIVDKKMYVSVARVDWTNAQMKSTLQKYAKYLILHPRGEFTYREEDQGKAGVWRTEALRVVKEIRALGYTSPIEIGTTGYGQTWSTIKRYGAEVAASDPLHNTLFLLQLYSEYAKTIPATLNEIVAFPAPVIVDACLFTSTYGNTPNTYKEVWDQTLPKGLSSFYWDWWGDGEGNSMTSSGTFASLNAIGNYLVNDSPAAALKNTVKAPFISSALVP